MLNGLTPRNANVKHSVHSPPSKSTKYDQIGQTKVPPFQDHAGVTPRQLAVMAEDFELASYLESQEEVEFEKLEQGKSVFVNRGDFETPV